MAKARKSPLVRLVELWGKMNGLESDDWSNTDLAAFGQMLLLDFVRRCGFPANLKRRADAYIGSAADHVIHEE